MSAVRNVFTAHCTDIHTKNDAVNGHGHLTRKRTTAALRARLRRSPLPRRDLSSPPAHTRAAGTWVMSVTSVTCPLRGDCVPSSGRIGNGGVSRLRCAAAEYVGCVPCAPLTLLSGGVARAGHMPCRLRPLHTFRGVYPAGGISYKYTPVRLYPEPTLSTRGRTAWWRCLARVIERPRSFA